MRVSARSLLLAAAQVSGSALACSGPGAPAAIERATLVGWACVFFSAFATAAVILRRLPLRTPVSKVAATVGVVLLLAHPGVWLSATRGDCGMTLLVVAPAATLLHAAAAAFLALRQAR